MELIDLSMITDIEKKLEEKCEMFLLTSSYGMTAVLRATLKQNNILSHVQYLLAEGVNSRNYLYSLYSKDDIKIPEAKFKVFYAWDKEKCLWEQCDKSELQNTYIKDIIEKIYYSICRLVSKLEVVHKISPFAKYDQKLLETPNDLREALIKMMHYNTKNSNIREIINRYTEYLIDEKFVSHLNPRSLLPVANKQVVNLKTGQVRDRLKSDYFTQEIPVAYNPDSRSELWENSISQIMVNDVEKVRFLQEIIGYSISGDASEGKIIFFIGDTKSAKSFLMILIGMIMGKFATNLNRSVLIRTKRSSDEPDPFVASLENKRIGIIDNLEQRDIINVAKYKALASNEKYVYRKLFSNDVENTQSDHVLFLAVNHCPRFKESDDSLWERMVFIDFKARFTENPSKDYEFPIDKKLLSKLGDEKEKEAVLKWMIDGAIRYYAREKLDIPESNLETLEHYADLFQSSFDEYFSSRLKLTDDDKDRIQVTLLNDDYKNWCFENGIEEGKIKELADFLHGKGIYKKKNNNTYYTHVIYK